MPGERHVTPEPQATGGLDIARSLDVDETAGVAIKNGAGRLYWLHAMNMTASVIYLKIYDQVAASVTVGTTTPALTIPLPTQGDTNGAGTQINIGSHGAAFATGISMACTSGLADNDTGDPGGNACVVNAGYK